METAKNTFCSIIFFLIASLSVKAQNCDKVEMIPSGQSNIDVSFDSFGKYLSGITKYGATRLKINVDNSITLNPDCRWNLVVLVENDGGATPNDEWQTLFTQSVSGDAPKVDIMQLRITNPCQTSQTGTSFFNIPLVSGTPIMVITNTGITTPAGSCTTNVNGPGNANQNYNEFTFDIDYKIIPGTGTRSGVYQLRVRFLLTEAY